jgi:glycosyltransferase involved in cell wall biosynthesis
MKPEERNILFIQPALPMYRLGFFDRINRETRGCLKVFYSPGGLDALTDRERKHNWEYPIGNIVRIGRALEWQRGTFRVPICKGDVLVVSGAPRALSNIVLLIRGRVLGAQVVWWGHYWSSTSKQWRLVVRRWLMRLADAVLFYTDQEVTEYLAGTKDRRPVVGLNNGIEVEAIRRNRKSYVASERATAALFIGRLSSKASVDVLFKAMTDRQLSVMHLHVVGWGDSGPHLQTLAEDYGLTDRVSWHGALTDEESIAAVANRCRAFVYPGSVGLSLIHGMAYGLPAVVHSDRWRHMPEIAAFEDEETGRSFVPGDHSDLARVLASLLTDTVILDQYSRRCIEVTDNTFNTEDMTRRFVGLIRQLE